MSNNFALPNDDSDDGDFQEFLNNLPELSPIPTGKRGGGRKSNNIGADILSVTMLDELKNHHKVNLTKRENIKANYLYGIIDRNSYYKAVQESRNIESSYSQVGVLAMSITKTNDGEIVLQLWRGNVVDNTLSFKKVFYSKKDYKYGQNKDGLVSFWRTDDNGKMYSFNELGTIVDFEVYLNAIVTETELPVSFLSDDVSKLQGLSEILANVNTVVDSTEVEVNEFVNFDDESDEDEDQ